MNRKKTYVRLLLAAALFVGSQPAATAQSVDLIPRPVSVQTADGQFRLTAKSVIGCDAASRGQADYLQDLLSRSTGWDLAVKEGARRADIRLAVDSALVTRPEGYRLEVTPKGVLITGADASGVFYGVQSLLQLFPPQVYSRERQRGVEWTARSLTIEDAPDHPWRGMMLDVARYFFDKDFVKKYIDMMAMYKLNKLQFHLVDDSGWRLEIKKYPRLTEVGAWAGPDSKRLGGYYTQDDIREIVAYAKVRGVDVIPEIEFPAHILSAIVAYPWLGCTGEQHEVPTQHFISRDLICVGKESSVRFLSDVLDEVTELFPSKYINIGGDEAVYTRWEQCPDCQALMKRLGLKKASELQGYLTNVVADMMARKGRTAVGWEEIIFRGKVSQPVVAAIWHNPADTARAIAAGHKAVLMPASYCYFDFPESTTPGEVKAATWQPAFTSERTYSLPMSDYSPASGVLGVQGCLWSDQFIHGDVLQEIPYLDENRSEQYAEYLTFPRLLALSEIGWCTNAARDYADFQRRLAGHFARLDQKGCNYRVPEPRVAQSGPTADGRYRYRLESAVTGAQIRYTTDGSYPTVHSALYEGGDVVVGSKDDFRAITVVTPRHYSLPLYSAPDYSAYAQYGRYAAEWKPLRIQTKPAPWRFECTGKVAANGTFHVTFIPTRGQNGLHLGELKLYKRDELLATVPQDAVATPGSPVGYTFTVDAFEAGTPFYIEVQANGQGGNDTAGLVFIRQD